jgi:peroxiredoxin
MAGATISIQTGDVMMIRRLAMLLVAVLAMPVWAALETGAVAPGFETRASLAGEAFDFSLSEALDRGTVVVYFYPSAYTRGCNLQAREFALNLEKFQAAGASVIGVSLDSIERLNDFSSDPEYCAGKLPVASDPNGEIARSYGIAVAEARPGMKDTRGIEIGHGFAERTTFIVTPDGRIAETIGGVSPAENVQRSLQAVRRLAEAD